MTLDIWPMMLGVNSIIDTNENQIYVNDAWRVTHDAWCKWALTVHGGVSTHGFTQNSWFNSYSVPMVSIIELLTWDIYLSAFLMNKVIL